MMNKMGGSFRKNWFKIVLLLGSMAAVILLLAKRRVSARRTGSPFAHLFTQAAQTLDWSFGWYRLPRLVGLMTLIGLRMKLREENLYDTSADRSGTEGGDTRHVLTRTADGSYNDLKNPDMGRAGTRFGRNVPLEYTYPDPEPAILMPNPRTVSRELLTRHTFQPATTLNLLAAAWLQFMIRDWFSHGESEKANPWQLPLREDDPWHERPMRILRTRRDPTRSPDANGSPPTYLNTESHWWDGSQLYGSNAELQAKVRSGEDGKLITGPEGSLPTDFLVELGNVPGWWVGLALLQTLFTREHNAICDHLRATYPAWSDDDLFDHARLINAALLAKIHTVEWTTAILGHPTMQLGMRANWWGLMGERFYQRFGRISASEVISGIPGSPTDHHTASYALTEEFVAVYRMHPLIPDDFSVRSVANDQLLQERAFPQIAGKHVQGLLEQVAIKDLFYSFGVAHPGAITLHNYPRSLQQFERPDGITIDLAATDIMRTRELGVPRYNKFRQLLHLPPVKSFEALTDNPVWAEELRRVYNNDMDQVDLMIGMFAERLPKGFGFSDTAFRIFILMASRRLKSDRFFTTDYTPEVYTPAGMDWINNNNMSTVLLRHFPALGPAFRHVENAFAPWSNTAR